MAPILKLWNLSLTAFNSRTFLERQQAKVCGMVSSATEEQKERESGFYWECVEESNLQGFGFLLRPDTEEAKGYTTSGRKQHMGWAWMMCEELIGILFANKWARRLQLGLKEKEEDVVVRVSIPPLAFHKLSHRHNVQQFTLGQRLFSVKATHGSSLDYSGQSEGKGKCREASSSCASPPWAHPYALSVWTALPTGLGLNLSRSTVKMEKEDDKGKDKDKEDNDKEEEEGDYDNENSQQK